MRVAKTTIRIEYESGASLNIGSEVKFSFDFNPETKELENWKCKMPFAFNPQSIPPLIPVKSLRSFCKQENIEAVYNFVIPEPDICVLDGFHYFLRLRLPNGRCREISCGDDLIDKIPAIQFFERYAKRVRKINTERIYEIY